LRSWSFYIEPEMREDHGEFEAEKGGAEAAEWTDLKGSLHNHRRE
jgi:hypothetical protein